MDEAPAIDVAFLPTEVRATQLAVVVDVLRASTTIAAALAGGFSRVLCVDDAERAEQLRGPGRALAGERECRPIPGFDYGNSPGALDAGEGRELVLSTTNGSPAILAAAAEADEVLVGSLVNLEAVIEAVADAARVTVVCCGTHGRVALEDLYAAGRIVARLEGGRSDAARAAERLADAYPDAYDALAESADAAVLRETDQEDDIAFCARESVLEVVPHVSAVSSGVATVSDRRDVEIPQDGGKSRSRQAATDVVSDAGT
jgi:2-phosphosulfolactate phosphatase